MKKQMTKKELEALKAELKKALKKGACDMD